MGMFDQIMSSAPIGYLTNEYCQTKDIDESEGGTMSLYWVDPNGALWYVDYSGTSDFVKDGDGYVRVRSGNRGKVTRFYLSKTIVIYTAKTQPDGLIDIIECKLIFEEGLLQNNSYK